MSVNCHHGGHAATRDHHAHAHAATPAATAKDPVCGMTVDPSGTPHHHEHGGATYHFCSGGCRAKFAADPERYLAKVEPPVRDGDAVAAVKDPVCGMTVDPARTPHHHEHHGTAYHFCSAGCLAKFAADPDRYLDDRPAAPTGPKDAV